MNKQCTRCSQTKPLAAFSKRADRPDGLGYACKACNKIARTIYYLANATEIQNRNTKWRAAHPSYGREWQAAHPDYNRERKARQP